MKPRRPWFARDGSWAGRPIPLATWIWRSYAKTALAPLLLVEVALIAIYIQTNAASREAHIDILRQEATLAMRRIAQQQADNVSRQLNTVTQLTDLYRRQAALALANPARAGLEDSNRYRFNPDGAYHTWRDDGGSTVFYSGVVPVGPAEREKVRRTAALDPLMKQIKAVNPLVVQIYLNTHDSLNRLYPYMEVTGYPVRMNIPSYNFYYEADASHNPGRKTVWTNVYLDPAGQGWLASCIAPVYRGGFLEGVVGLDITVGTIAQQILDLNLPWGAYAVLIGKDGSILAMPKPGEQDFGMGELVSHQYAQAVKQDTFKPDAFNLYRNPRWRELAARQAAAASGLTEADIGGERLVSWHRVEETGWTILIVASPANIFDSTYRLSQGLQRLAYAMIAALVLFYLLFFAALLVRARIASRSIASPLKRIESMMLAIGRGEYEQPAPAFDVGELHETARELSCMGRELGATHHALLEAQLELREHVRWLEAVFELSPDGLVTFDESGRARRANPAFLAMTGFRNEMLEGRTVEEFQSLVTSLTANPGHLLLESDPGFTLDFVRPRPRTVQCQVRAFGMDGGLASGSSLIAYFRDMTREIELDRMKSEFLATAAHELRTPLTAVSGYAELLAMGEYEPELQKSMAATILEKTHGLIAIVADLLDLSRLESRHGRDFDIGPQPLEPIVRDTLRDFGGAHPGPLQCSSGGVPPGQEVLVDRVKFSLALIKVLENARAFSPPDAPIEVCLKSRANDLRHELGVEVTDHGVGMTPEQQQRMFERFYRADTSGQRPGTGLGMSIVKEIMDVHRGSVEVESEPGRGTTVCLWLEAAAPGPVRRLEAPAE
ncbi:MAG: ATP-binding protein [Methylococcus sp.]